MSGRRPAQHKKASYCTNLYSWRFVTLVTPAAIILGAGKVAAAEQRATSVGVPVSCHHESILHAQPRSHQDWLCAQVRIQEADSFRRGDHVPSD